MGPFQMPELGQAPRFDGPAGADDRHPVAELFDLAEDMAGEQHRRPVRGDPPDLAAEHGVHHRIQAGTRLIEQIQPGRAGERGDQCHLLRAFGVCRAFCRGSSQILDQFPAQPFLGAAAQPGEQFNDFPAGQVRPEAHVPGNVGDVPVRADRVPRSSPNLVPFRDSDG